jgi:hypothetical protein
MKYLLKNARHPYEIPMKYPGEYSYINEKFNESIMNN